MAEQKSDWSEAYVDELPDSAFLYVEARGSKDAAGKTIPRALRHFPCRDKNGAVDRPHLERAISRIPDSPAPGLTPGKKEALLKEAKKLLKEGPKEAGGEKKAGSLSVFIAALRDTPPQKIAMAAGLFIVILVAIFFVAKKAGFMGGKVQPPPIVMDKPVTKIETKTPYKEVTLSFGEWNKLGFDAQGRYKDPATKEYDMVSPIKCLSCGKTIPDVVYPADKFSMPPGSERSEALLMVRNEYKCPLCGKSAYTVINP